MRDPVAEPASPVVPDGQSDWQLEAELMRQVAVGEIGGLEALYDRYHGMAYALALRIKVTATNGLDHARIVEVRAYS